MNSLSQDVRFAFRQLMRAPRFALTIMFTLALGVGAATAVFSVLDATLIRSLPFTDPEQLVVPETRAMNGYLQPWSYPTYLDVRSDLRSLDTFAGYNAFTRITLEGPSGPASLQAIKSTDNFFEVFRVLPILGRVYRRGEDQPGKDDVAVLSYEVWQSQFSGQNSVIGRRVHLDGAPYTIIGVMPHGFRFPLEADNAIYLPLHPDAESIHNRNSHWMLTVGRLKSGTSISQAQPDLTRLLANLSRSYPDSDLGRTAELIPLHTAVSGHARQPLIALSLAVLALLAISCVNVTGLLLARGIRREREMALRAAVGAGRSRLVRQVIVESAVFSAGGLLLGIAIAYGMLALLRTYLVASLARGLDVRVNWLVLAVSVLLSGATSLLASLVPAFRMSRISPDRALRAGGVSVGIGRHQQMLRSSLVIVQISFSLLLLIVSGVLVNHLHRLLSTPLGFVPGRIITTRIALSPGRYGGRDPLTSFYQPLIDRVSRLPGVQAAGLIDILPIERWGHNQNVHITGQPPYSLHDQRWVENRLVTEGYFDAMGIQLLRGRRLSPALDPYQNPAGTVVINEAFRRRFFSSEDDPTTAHIDDAAKAELKTSIVGVVSDVRQHLVEPALPEIDQLIDEYPPTDRLTYMSNMTLVIRSDGTSTRVTPPLRSIVHDLDPTVPFQEPENMTVILDRSMVFERLEGVLFEVFAVCSLCLALLGLYGLVSQEVQMRTRDIGVRLALGAVRGRIVRQILARVAMLMLIGVTFGWVLAIGSYKLLLLLIQIDPLQDLWLFAALTLTLGLTGIMASLWPAYRAASLNPVQALREN